MVGTRRNRDNIDMAKFVVLHDVANNQKIAVNLDSVAHFE
jgi:hypothetical protein